MSSRYAGAAFRRSFINVSPEYAHFSAGLRERRTEIRCANGYRLVGDVARGLRISATTLRRMDAEGVARRPSA